MQGEILQEEPKEKTAEKKDAFAKYTAKDSVFSTLFQDKKYLIQLYRALHPEDMETTEDALMDITIRNVLTNGIYNDLAFRVGDKVMFLVEHQSSWTMNIIIRVLMYLVQIYHDYFEEQDADLYGSKKVHVPEPELYMIFTGERASRPETISLSKEFFGGKECAIEVGREKEVISIMMALFDEEKIMRTHIASEKKAASKETARKAAERMLRLGKLSAEEIAGCFTELSVEDIQEIEKGLLQTV